jgi:hypothetical protein
MPSFASSSTKDTFGKYIKVATLVTSPRLFLLNNLILKIRRHVQAGTFPVIWTIEELEAWCQRTRLSPQVAAQAGALWDLFRHYTGAARGR